VRNGFVPSYLQSRSENRHDARPGRLALRPVKLRGSPKLLERWRGEWRAKGELAFPGIGRRRGADFPALDDARRIAELEHKIGQLTDDGE
jgi:hypothetical protein